MKEKYGSHLKLIDAFRLHRALSVFGMFSVSTGVVDHEANQRVLGLLLKIKKKKTRGAIWDVQERIEVVWS